jgi:phage replication O-like protein O
MASPQPTYFTKVSDELAEAFCRYRISGEAWQVLWVVLRLTYGYQRKEAVIPQEEIIRLTRLEKRQIFRALAWLKKKNVVNRDKNFLTSLNKDYDTWNISPGIVDNLESGVTKNGSIGDKKRFEEVTKNGSPSFLYRKTVGKDIKTSPTFDKSGDKSERKRKIQEAKISLTEKMTM